MAIFESSPPLILVFLSGMLSALTPCILPILPPMLAGSIGHRLKPIFILSGAGLSFTFMGGLFSLVGSIYAREALRYFFIFLLFTFGLIYAEPGLNEAYAKYSSILISKFSGRISDVELEKKNELISAFILGISLGIIWIPCVGPILGSVLAYATYRGNVIYGSFLLLVYSLGLSLPVLTIAYGGKRSAKAMSWVRKNSKAIEQFAGIVMILTAFAILLGYDKLLQAKLVPYISDLELKLLEFMKSRGIV